MDTLFIGQQIIKLATVDSTNNYAANMLSMTKVVDGTVIMADYQENGKGQRGSTWVSKKGENLLFSLVVYPKYLSVSQQFYLSKVVAIALQESLSNVISNVKIKWPNDIYANGKKISGVLIENSLDKGKVKHSIIGIGINVNQMEFPLDRMTSVRNESGIETEIMELLNLFCISFEKYFLNLKSSKFDLIDQVYNDNLLFLGEERDFIVNQSLVTGIITRVNPQGFLIVKENGLEKEYDLKEISFFPSPSQS